MEKLVDCPLRAWNCIGRDLQASAPHEAKLRQDSPWLATPAKRMLPRSAELLLCFAQPLTQVCMERVIACYGYLHASRDSRVGSSWFGLLNQQGRLHEGCSISGYPYPPFFTCGMVEEGCFDVGAVLNNFRSPDNVPTIGVGSNESEGWSLQCAVMCADLASATPKTGPNHAARHPHNFGRLLLFAQVLL